jgi:hypothetical protein
LDKDFIRSTISEIEKELQNLAELRKEMKEIGPDVSILLRRSAGSILHDFYNCCERVFKKVAMDINGGHEDSDKWHKALMFRMTLSVRNLRPALISEELAAELDEYLSFRHVFRNIYGFELKGERLLHLRDKFDDVAKKFDAEIKIFLRFILFPQKLRMHYFPQKQRSCSKQFSASAPAKYSEHNRYCNRGHWFRN